jgi:hypothetical protein
MQRIQKELITILISLSVFDAYPFSNSFLGLFIMLL